MTDTQTLYENGYENGYDDGYEIGFEAGKALMKVYLDLAKAENDKLKGWVEQMNAKEWES